MRRTKFYLAAALVILAASAPGVRGDTTVTVSGSGSDGQLAAQALFAITGGEIEVTITNTLNPRTIVSAGQAVSDLSFTLSNAPGTDGINTASGQLVDVSGKNKADVTDVTGDPGRWIGLETDKNGHVLGGFNISGDVITLEAIGGGQPSEMILPSDGSGYADANPSITKPKNFAPFVDGPATFTLHLSGVTSSTEIKGVKFSFGTSPDTFLSDGTCSGTCKGYGVPEPSGMLMLGSDCLGLAGLAFVFRRRLKRQ